MQITIIPNSNPYILNPYPFEKETAVGVGREAEVISQEEVQATTHFTSPYLTQTELHKFCTLAFTWEEETINVSSAIQIVMNPSYQQIIGMGMTAVPLILKYLKIKENHWFWALKAITGVDPITESDKGDISKMIKAWLQWGEKNGYIL